MYPWLLYATYVQVPTYGTMLVVGLLVATAAFRREAARQGWPTRVPVDVALLSIPAVLVGSRAAHVVFEMPDRYWMDPSSILLPSGGLVFYGGAAGLILTAWSYARHRGLEFRSLADVMAPGACLGMAMARLGCLGAGCCYGLPTGLPWGVRLYVRRVPEPFLATPLHPSALYESLFALMLFVALTQLRRGQGFRGQVMATWLMAYGLGRFAIEFTRGDIARGLWLDGMLSTSQIIGLSLAAIASLLWLRWSRVG